ncbi:hypothetical protein [Actinomadura formosensis]|nr:hypothetical protein [Actinomadura formosensis]
MVVQVPSARRVEGRGRRTYGSGLAWGCGRAVTEATTLDVTDLPEESF